MKSRHFYVQKHMYKGYGQLYCAYVFMHIEFVEIQKILIYIYVYTFVLLPVR
jgi:hypothetical protein